MSTDDPINTLLALHVRKNIEHYRSVYEKGSKVSGAGYLSMGIVDPKRFVLKKEPRYISLDVLSSHLKFCDSGAFILASKIAECEEGEFIIGYYIKNKHGLVPYNIKVRSDVTPHCLCKFEVET